MQPLALKQASCRCFRNIFSEANKFAYENEALWKLVIVGKYREEEGGWRSRVLREGYGVGLWKAIRNGRKEFNNRFDFKVRKWWEGEVLE